MRASCGRWSAAAPAIAWWPWRFSAAPTCRRRSTPIAWSARAIDGDARAVRRQSLRARRVPALARDRLGGETSPRRRHGGRGHRDAARARPARGGCSEHRAARVAVADRRSAATAGRRLRDKGRPGEAEQLVAALVSPAHAHQLGESAVGTSAVQDALRSHGASVQSVTRGSGTVVYDEYSVVVNTMPPALTPEQYLREMAADLNRAVSSEDFDDVNTFERTAPDRRRGAPAVGDVYDIDILGPDNGSVMLVESTADHFTFQTVTTSQTGEHPENGSRSFGFERLGGGAVKFYTRGVSRPGSDLVRIVGGGIQTKGWTALVTGIGAALVRRGGTLRPGSFSRSVWMG